MSSDCEDLLLSLSEAMLYPKQARLFSFELFLVINLMFSLNDSFDRQGYLWRIFIVTYHFVWEKTRHYVHNC